MPGQQRYIISYDKQMMILLSHISLENDTSYEKQTTFTTTQKFNVKTSAVIFYYIQ